MPPIQATPVMPPMYAAPATPNAVAIPPPMHAAPPTVYQVPPMPPMHAAPPAGHGTPPPADDSDAPPPDARDQADDIITDNNDETARLQQKTLEAMEEADRKQTAAIEGQFYTGMALREVGQQGQDFADGFVRFVETREQIALNKLETQLGREEVSFPDAVSDWVSFGDELKAKEDRRAERMDRIGDLMEGELPGRSRES